MKHLDYLELLTNPLAGGGGGGGITPSGSITINKNSTGVDVTNKATAIVSVQGGLDANYVPYVIPTGYTEYPCVEDKTREQIETYDPQGETASLFWVLLDDTHPPVPATGTLVAVTGVTSDTHDPYMVIGHTIESTTAGEGRQRIRLAYDDAPTFGVGNPVMDITANGNNIDVKGRNAVNVNVPSVQPTGSVTIKQNTDSTGVDVANKAKAIVDVQGGVDYNFVQPSVPSGYTEIKMPNSLKSTTVSGYTAGQTNKQISAYLPLWATLNVGDKIAITGITTDTGEKYCIAGTVSGNTAYTNYQYAKLTIDYNGMLGSAAVVPTGYTEIKALSVLSASTIRGYVAGQSKTATVPHDAVVAVNDKVALTGLTQDTGDEFVVVGTVTNTSQTSSTQTVYLTLDANGCVGVTAPAIVVKSNGSADVKGRESTLVDVHGTGTIQITENGQVTVDGYKYANVQVPIPVSGAATRLDGMESLSNFCGSYSRSNQSIVAVQLPDATSIHDCFNYMSNLTEVYIGKNIYSLSNVFEEGVPNLTSVAFDKDLQSVPSWSLYGYIPSSVSFYVPDSLVQSFQQAVSTISSQIFSRVGMPWSATFAPFANGEIVTHNNQQWVSTADNNNGEPGVGADWSPYSP